MKEKTIIQNGHKYKIYTNLPKNWRVLDGGLTAPSGYVWIKNNKGIFSGEVEFAFMKI